MDTLVTGGCLCRAVRFQFDTPPIATRACWCRDCQYLAAGNATVNLIVASAGFSCTGQVSEYVSVAASGTSMRRCFCPACGTPLFSHAASRPNVMVIRAGALDDPAIGKPAGVIWTASAPSWAQIDESLPRCEGQPPPVPAS